MGSSRAFQGLIGIAVQVLLFCLGCEGASEAPGKRTVDAGAPEASAPACASDGGVLEADGGPFALTVTPTVPISMDDVTVFAHSQVDDPAGDPQVTALGPDMTIRALNHWDLSGRQASDYNATYIDACHTGDIRIMGGQTTVTFADEWSSDTFPSVVTRDSRGAMIEHDEIYPKLYFGSWASPTFRADLVAIGKLQIDAGLDGIFFDVADGDFTGASYDGDEGFDDGHLADFNRYLLAKYPGADFATLFQMSPDNLLRADLPAGDVICNFNYRRYLASNGWAGNPFSPANPLGAEWQRAVNSRAPTGGTLSFEPAVTYRQFLQVTTTLRQYARQKYGRDIYITSNGIFPYVDFQGVGLYDGNDDGDGGAEADYVPLLNDGHLDGTTSLKSTFLRLAAESAALAPGAPVVLFIDWPSGPMTRFLGLSASERQDYWRIYAAEAYANGLYFAFFLADTVGDPSATDLGLMPLYQSLTGFYRAEQALYHHQTVSDVDLGLPGIMATVTDQTQPRRRIVHLVNHHYDAGLIEQQNVAVSLPVAGAPSSVTLVSPGLTGETSLPFTYSNAQVEVTVPSLVAYDVLLIAY
jgi:hypothetical protein